MGSMHDNSTFLYIMVDLHKTWQTSVDTDNLQDTTTKVIFDDTFLSSIVLWWLYVILTY